MKLRTSWPRWTGWQRPTGLATAAGGFHGRSGDHLCARGICPERDGGHRFWQPFTVQRYGEPDARRSLAWSVSCSDPDTNRSDPDKVAHSVRRLLDVTGSRRDQHRAPW